MKFVKYEDMQRAIDDAYSWGDLQFHLENLPTYEAEYKAHMPIRIRDYSGDEPVEYDCGEDLKYHRLAVTRDGALGFYNSRKHKFSCDSKLAEELHECCFVANCNSGKKIGRCRQQEPYIAPERLLVLKEVEDETV